jgi:hypothetical protein
LLIPLLVQITSIRYELRSIFADSRRTRVQLPDGRICRAKQGFDQPPHRGLDAFVIARRADELERPAVRRTRRPVLVWIRTARSHFRGVARGT